MSLTLVTKPAMEPLSVEQVKSNSRIFINDDDIFIEQLIKQVRVWTEGYLRRALITQTQDWRLDTGFPCSPFNVPLGKLQSIDSIKYIDTNGDEQTLAASVYDVDIYSDPGRVSLAYGQSWPSVRSGIMNNVTIRFTCGYGALQDVEKDIVRGMLLMVSHFYENREATVVGTDVKAMPLGVEALLWPCRIDH